MSDLCSRPNPDKMVYEMVSKMVAENDGYCPCSLVKNEDTLCPCKKYREQNTEGVCHCGRFEKVYK